MSSDRFSTFIQEKEYENGVTLISAAFIRKNSCTCLAHLKRGFIPTYFYVDFTVFIMERSKQAQFRVYINTYA